MSAESLLAASCEATRAVDLAREAEDYEQDASERGTRTVLPGDAARHCYEAAAALERAALRLTGEAFRLRRGAHELKASHAREFGGAA